VVVALIAPVTVFAEAASAVTKSTSGAEVSSGFVTVKQAAALGILPGISTPGFTASTPTVEHVVSDSASGCNQLVCINLVGSGLTVTSWSTSGTYTIQTPAFAIYYKNGVVIATSVIVEAEPGETLGDQMIGTHSFPNGTQLCNGWGGTLGHPCETIEG
jgi:hypothetical protein